MAKRTATKKPAAKTASVNTNQNYGADFKKNYHYKICYLVGKFRLYIYDNEYHQKIDANQFQIMCGHIPAHEDIFNDFRKHFPVHTMSAEVGAEFDRVGMKVADAFKKVAGTQDWFRVTFNELKYTPGEKQNAIS